ncbi:Trk-type K+ transport system membrane component [Virgibacillus natechei]|uniref:Trk-type K+ transport system membrane component n=1 Tax=Virgibacillus natechei TaxID=1216297 RepID=A0ABS4IBH1_9BACI|nr:TrkH family potassium uptake protein [Virgibacillus natechei]MBP1968275.1 Trk-type K+ transport system membrane component [Virgibacillus natechei]UZD14459.1 TrkH family potassium uptake protein [Virgibacillus natechei]
MKYRYPFASWINKLSPLQILLIFYFIAVLFSTIIMSMPIVYQDGVEIEFIDVLFTAVSALSVTGLSTITVADTLSTTGILVLAFIMQLGAVGIMAIGTFIWLLMGKKIGLKERRLIMADQNQTSFAGMVRLIKQIVYVLLTVEFIAFIVLGTYYLQYFPTTGEAYLQGLFGTISAVTNGGFDITGQSLIPFQDDYFVQFIMMLLIIFGAIGFPVLIEVKEYIFAKSESRGKMRFSLFTKVTTSTFLILVVVGALFIYILDAGNFFADKSWHEALFYSLFQSVTTRSGGLSTMDVSQLTDESHLFMSLLMFIGASPSSAGGGIRTTTFALVVIFVIIFAKGGKSIRIFNREVYEEDLLKAVAVTLMAFVFVFISILIISTIEPFSLNQILFEVTSAFGTVGLSLGITSELTTFSKTILMLLMFIGRVGLISLLFSFKNNKKKVNYHYPKEKMIIG